MSEFRSVAYFSMEIAVDPGMPTYAGGLGVLAGDTVRAAADMALPMIAVTLLHRNGYMFQQLDAAGWQTEEDVHWPVDDFLEELRPRVTVPVDGVDVAIRAWKYNVLGVDGKSVPVLFLDTDLPENEAWRRTLTNKLYGGDWYYRLCQEVVLGRGGVRMLRALEYTEIERFHMNEGHAALLGIELLEEHMRSAGRETPGMADVDAVRKLCIFTTHTPVAAGHDKFPLKDAARIVGLNDAMKDMGGVICCGEELNMTYLALNLSRYVNGVAKRHGEISRQMFQGYTIDAITNGVHAPTWVSRPFQDLFDRRLPGWRQDNFSLRHAVAIPGEEVWAAHLAAKKALIQFLNRELNAGFDVDHFTLGFARRAAPYKRGGLPLSDPARLQKIAREQGPLQFVFAGKAHPGDDAGKGIIQRIFKEAQALKNEVNVIYAPNYDMELGRLITSGVDVWLNTPQPPLEASGTSGMKAALNGVPSLSVLDGWWVEGCIEGFTGWCIGDAHSLDDGRDRWDADAASFYNKLEQTVAPLFYKSRDAFVEMMRETIALNGSYFNCQRMLQQYVVKAYFR